MPASERYRLDLGGDVVVAFVEGLSPEHSGKVAYVTHVPSGSQLLLDRDGRTVDRHDGRGDGPSRLDAVLSDPLAMERIMERLQNDEDARPREMIADWVHSVQFGGITYTARWMVVGPETISRENDLTQEDLGPELYRVAFRIDGYGGSFYQDGDATYLNPGTPVYGVKGYSQVFRLAILEDGEVTLFEADTNPGARIGEDLLDIRGEAAGLLGGSGSLRCRHRPTIWCLPCEHLAAGNAWQRLTELWYASAPCWVSAAPRCTTCQPRPAPRTWS